MLTRQIEKAQRKVESHNFDIRKQLLLFDDVANDQRKVVYQQRTEIMGTEDLSAAITGIREEALGVLMDPFMPKSAAPQDWDLKGLSEALARDFGATVDPASWLAAEPELEEAPLRQRVIDEVAAFYDAKVAQIGAPIMRHVEKDVMLQTVDRHWREHLAAMDYLRQGIHLRGYAQKDYRFEYKREAFELFAAMLDRVKFDVVSLVSKVQVRTQEEAEREEELRRDRLMQALHTQHAEAQSALAAAAPAGSAGIALPAAIGSIASGALPGVNPGADGIETFVRQDRKVGRNEPCPCGSGKKFKHCHGALSSAG
jgi:preprotein translocase subunit SecA